MGLTTDPNDPCIKNIQGDGQQACYLVLSEEERAKGFVRPVRHSYKHVGVRPTHPTRELTPEEHERYDQFGYILYEEYPAGSSMLGRFWTQALLNSGCGAVTTMGQALAETYAANPSFYGSTFCVKCGKHFRVGADGEFDWMDGTKVGT